MGLCQGRAIQQVQSLQLDQTLNVLSAVAQQQHVVFHLHLRVLFGGLRHMTFGCPAATCPFRGYHLAGLAGWRDAQVHSSCAIKTSYRGGRVNDLTSAFCALPFQTSDHQFSSRYKEQ